MQPTATTALVLPWPFSELASNKASIESFLADSMKPQVFTRATSADSTSSTRVQPSAANRPANSSESTSLREHPKVTTATVRFIDQILAGYESTPYDTLTTSPSRPTGSIGLPLTVRSTPPAFPSLRFNAVSLVNTFVEPLRI